LVLSHFQSGDRGKLICWGTEKTFLRRDPEKRPDRVFVLFKKEGKKKAPMHHKMSKLEQEYDTIEN